MDLLWRTGVAMGKIMSLLAGLLLNMATDTIGDTIRILRTLGQIMKIVLSEAAVNPVFAIMASIVLGAVGFFFYRVFQSNAKSVAVTLIIAMLIFIISAVLTML